MIKKKLQKFHKNLKIEPPCDPAVPLLGIYPKVLKTGYWSVICTSILIVLLSMIAKIWNHLSAHEWMNDVLYTHTHTHTHTHVCVNTI